jgi:hypothetical protein
MPEEMSFEESYKISLNLRVELLDCIENFENKYNIDGKQIAFAVIGIYEMTMAQSNCTDDQIDLLFSASKEMIKRYREEISNLNP